MLKLYLDPGHGTLVGSSYDGGTTAVDKTRESVIVLDIAKAVRDRLKGKCHLLMSRTDEAEVKGVMARAAEANIWGADVFISFHCNGFDDPTANGTSNHIYAFGGEAERYAHVLQDNLLAALGTRDRGVKLSNVAVLRETDMPAVLIEFCFVTNASDYDKLVHNRSAVIDAVVESIKEIAIMIGKPIVETYDIKPAELYVGSTKLENALLINGVTYAPARELVDAFKPTITWDAEAGVAVIEL